ncbi:MAG: glycine--tRNA ligase subunit beta [Nitrospiraceae bacterium]
MVVSGKSTQTKSHTRKKPATGPVLEAAELLFEIGSEELPYQFIPPALLALKDSAEQLLKEHRLPFQSARTIGTPRRLTLVVEGLAVHQAGTMKETMGPSKAVAFDQSGQPTKAALGFATGQGVAVQELQIRQTPKGEYVFAVKREAGRPTKTVLLELLPALVSKLSFPKSMKWNEAGVRFARPVRWLVALYGGTVVPAVAAGITAGTRTYGHRVLGGGKAIAVRNFKTYAQVLDHHGVLPDPDRRRTIIREQLDRLCKNAGVEINADADLLEQAVFTTEWPCAILGSFKPEYLIVPSEILITSMKEHQGFFSVRDKKSGALAAHFVAVANHELKNMTLIREGNERVLAARLADAKFFFDEDRKIKLEERVKKLSGVTFHQKLGTLAQKQERVRTLASLIVSHLAPGNDELKQVCERAGGLCKTDLLTGIVGEFPELQGIMGGKYARHDGESKEVGLAISEQYLPRSIEGELPKTQAGQVLSLADRLDSVAAFFHVGLIPTGSEDPFALRRHATAIVRIILEGNLRLNLGKLLDHARNIVEDNGFKGVPDSEQNGRRRMTEFMFERVRHYGRTLRGLRDDVMEAVLKPAPDHAFDLVDLVFKMNALQAMTAKSEFDPLIIGFKRAHRIVEKEGWTEKSVDPAAFKDPAETELHRQIEIRRKDFDLQMSKGRYEQALNALVQLKPSIDAFFSAVMVNAEDPTIRSNRLSLLKEVEEFFLSFADFSQIVVQGS